MKVPTHREYRIATARDEMQIEVIHDFLSRSYWATGISTEIIARAIEHSRCYGVFLDREQVAFARVITDQATFAYLADVFVLEAHRGRGLSKMLMKAILEDPVRNLRRWLLVT